MLGYHDISSTNPKRFDVEADAVRNSLKNILYTRKGSFPGNPIFGSDLHEYVFSLNDSITKILVTNSIENAVKLWETRVKIRSIKVEAIPEYNRMDIYVYYTLADDVTGTVYTLNISI
jgi:phage baseplate assembly protein W